MTRSDLIAADRFCFDLQIFFSGSQEIKKLLHRNLQVRHAQHHCKRLQIFQTVTSVPAHFFRTLVILV
jgi:hypothetical protein